MSEISTGKVPYYHDPRMAALLRLDENGEPYLVKPEDCRDDQTGEAGRTGERRCETRPRLVALYGSSISDEGLPAGHEDIRPYVEPWGTAYIPGRLIEPYDERGRYLLEVDPSAEHFVVGALLLVLDDVVYGMLDRWVGIGSEIGGGEADGGEAGLGTRSKWERVRVQMGGDCWSSAWVWAKSNGVSGERSGGEPAEMAGSSGSAERLVPKAWGKCVEEMKSVTDIWEIRGRSVTLKVPVVARA